MLAATEEGLCEIRLLLLIGIASHHSFMFYVSFPSNPLLLKSLFENVSGKEEKLVSPQDLALLPGERLENITQMHTEASENRKQKKNPALIFILSHDVCGLSHDFKCLGALIAVCPHKEHVYNLPAGKGQVGSNAVVTGTDSKCSKFNTSELQTRHQTATSVCHH